MTTTELAAPDPRPAAPGPTPSTTLSAAQAASASREDKARISRWLLSAPALVTIAIFGILPLIIIVIYSFLKAAPYGGVVWSPSIEAYVSFLFQQDIFTEELVFSPDFLQIYLRSFIFAVGTTLLCLILGFPTAYFMATRPPRQRNWWVRVSTWSCLSVPPIPVAGRASCRWTGSPSTRARQCSPCRTCWTAPLPAWVMTVRSTSRCCGSIRRTGPCTRTGRSCACARIRPTRSPSCGGTASPSS